MHLTARANLASKISTKSAPFEGAFLNGYSQPNSGDALKAAMPIVGGVCLRKHSYLWCNRQQATEQKTASLNDILPRSFHRHPLGSFPSSLEPTDRYYGGG